MGERWVFINRFKLRVAVFMVVFELFGTQNLCFCSSLKSEGFALLRFRERIVSDPFGALSNWKVKDGDVDPCSWFGVECSDGKVVILNLKDLCLVGTLTPEIGKLNYLKSIILRNNSFSGNVPKEIGQLKDLEVLDLGFNNFSGPFPSDFRNNLSLSILLLDNNKLIGSIAPELYQLKMLSEIQVDENHLTGTALKPSCISNGFTWNIAQPGDLANGRRLQQVVNPPNPPKANERVSHSSLSPTPSKSSSLPPSNPPFLSLSPSPFGAPVASPSPFGAPFASPSPSETPFNSPSPSPSNIFLTPSPSRVKVRNPPPAPADSPVVIPEPPQSHGIPTDSPASTPFRSAHKISNSKHHMVLTLVGAIGGSLFVFISVIAIIFFRSSKVATVKPWATGLSGQLQKAFVTGVPNLKRAELEAACEDFSNIIGSFSDGTVYKGTLSSGVEIAVTSSAVTSCDDWSKNLEAQFRKKIETLSKVNHKNFVNLIGYCEEDQPFTRMMIFEYAPNGTLFEHLHIQEAEHLDWGMRLRIAMGMAYCLEHMHQMTPSIPHRNLLSSSVYLTEDYAAKISDFSFCNDAAAAKAGSATMELLETTSMDSETNVYSFGVILFEMITGRIPYSIDNGSLADWASDYLRSDQLPRQMVDPTLNSFQEDQLEKLFEVIKMCVHPNPKERPTMRGVAAKLKEITTLEPDGATPKVSPLWWAELEIMSTETS
ncbi:hypothetical protein SLA2020_521610 [Shorea laevis]